MSYVLRVQFEDGASTSVDVAGDEAEAKEALEEARRALAESAGVVRISPNLLVRADRVLYVSLYERGQERRQLG